MTDLPCPCMTDGVVMAVVLALDNDKNADYV